MADAPPQTLEFVIGDKFSTAFIWKNDGTPVDLTGWSADFTVEFAGTDTVYDDSPEVVIDALAGKVTVTISHTVTATWLATGAYRLRVIDADDEPTSLTWGRFAAVQCLP